MLNLYLTVPVLRAPHDTGPFLRELIPIQVLVPGALPLRHSIPLFNQERLLGFISQTCHLRDKQQNLREMFQSELLLIRVPLAIPRHREN
jgi:hypothetical protein